MSATSAAAPLHLNSLARLSLPGSARHLAVVRIAVCVHVMTVLSTPALDLIFHVPGHLMPWAKTLVPETLERVVAAELPVLVALGMTSAVCGALGLLSRVTLPLTALCFFFTQNFWFRMSLFHDDWLYFNAYLLVLSLSPCADAFAVDAFVRARRGRTPLRDPRHYRVAIEVMLLWFAGVYVAAGLSKLFPLVKVGLWLSGARPQEFAKQFLLDSPVYWLLGAPPFNYAELRFPFAFAAGFTVLAELGAIGLVLTHRYRAFILPAILMLHTGIFLLGIPGFVQAALVSMALFIPAERLERR